MTNDIENIEELGGVDLEQIAGHMIYSEKYELGYKDGEENAVKKIIGILEKDVRKPQTAQNDYFDVNDHVARQYIDRIKKEFGINAQ